MEIGFICCIGCIAEIGADFITSSYDGALAISLQIPFYLLHNKPEINIFKLVRWCYHGLVNYLETAAYIDVQCIQFGCSSTFE